MLSSIFSSYLRLLDTHPIVTKTITSGILVFSADIVAQRLEKTEEEKEHSTHVWNRSIRLTVWTIFVTPAIHTWFNFLQARTSSPLICMVIDQLVFAPTSLLLFLVSNEYIQSKSINKAMFKVKEKFWPILSANYLIWPLLAYLNFRFIPSNLRVVALSTASFFWSIYLSYMLHRPIQNSSVQRLAALEPPFGQGRHWNRSLQRNRNTLTTNHNQMSTLNGKDNQHAHKKNSDKIISPVKTALSTASKSRVTK